MPEISPIALSTLVIAITQIIKASEIVPQPQRFMPLVSLLLGIGLGLLAGLDIVASIMVGATASGFYDVTKKTVFNK